MKIVEYFMKFLVWILLIWCYMLMHCITFAFSQCFMYYKCVFICWNLCVVRIGLGWIHDAIFFARHMLMHISCICTFSFLYFGTFCDGVFLFLSLSLSLSLTVCAWHLSANPLHPGTLFVLGHHLLILLLFMSSFMLRRPVRTSWRPSPNVAFIRNATWFCHIVFNTTLLIVIHSRG